MTTPFRAIALGFAAAAVLGACRSSGTDETGSGARAESAGRTDTAGGMAGMPGMGGHMAGMMGAGTMDSVQAHMRTMDTMSADRNGRGYGALPLRGTRRAPGRATED
jgi:hypothetical protein